jgi:aldose 1-epimerase
MDGAAAADQMLLESDGCRVTIDLAHGGRLSALDVDGWALLVRDGVDPYHWGSFPMAPWVGRLRHGALAFGGEEYRFPTNAPPHALHGLVTERPWQPLDDGVLAIELAPPWPWAGRVIQEITPYPDRLEFALRLEADEPMPAALGWHPWFPRQIVRSGGGSAGPLVIDVMPGLMYEHDDEGIPTGELVAPSAPPWDYCFTQLKRPPELRWEGGLALTIHSDCSHWVIYDEEPQAVAVEPWTGPPNALNMSEPTIVTPTRPLTAKMVWRWRLPG